MLVFIDRKKMLTRRKKERDKRGLKQAYEKGNERCVPVKRS